LLWAVQCDEDTGGADMMLAILITQVVLVLMLLPFFFATVMGIWSGYLADKSTREHS